MISKQKLLEKIIALTWIDECGMSYQRQDISFGELIGVVRELKEDYDTDEVIEQLVDLIQGSTTEYGDGYNTAITDAIDIVMKGGIE